MRKAVVFTLGCKVNECESDSLITGLKERGYEVSDKLEKADLYIVNTCAVTLEAEKKSRQTASRIKKLNPDAKIIFTGCACQNNSKSFVEKSQNALVTGVFNKTKILSMLDDIGEKLSEESKEFEELLPVSVLRTRGYIKVQDGCNNFCSYCIIPYLRGRSRSRNPESILQEINSIGSYEVIINGINLSSYNFDGCDFAELIGKLSSVKKRIRLGSLEVRVIDDRLLENLKNLYDFAPHFHLSLQSGSNQVLKSMNRKYTREEFIEKVNLIRKYFPNAGITTDIIAGFPTETERNFLDTLDLISKVKFSDIHAFCFSARKGTVAYKMKDLSPEIKKDRLNRLLEKKEECKKDFIEKNIGKELEFIPEEQKDGYTVGYSGNYLRIYVKGIIKGEKIKVKVISPYGDGALAQI
ncbi:MAG: tRNA (N(6)-L-threonylcarbamoyladenosine(37)-C(2))-methylthiotransferase MtaB [Clostridia bacterium]|nr:tRNA (N(6)-L-threonylcarbamoyladenosine(37)-C(2))-methylthiotransferase MtaB [Clostridia bacterium]